MGQHNFTLLDLIPGFSHLYIPWWMSMMIFVVLLLVFLAVISKILTRFNQDKLYPEKKNCAFRNIIEVLIEALLSFVHSILGDHARQFFPLLGTLFLFIFVSNVLGLVPGFLPPTSHLTVNLGCALTVFFYYHYCGVREHGVGYLKHFLGPVIWLAPLMLIVELIGHCVRPFSLSLRLFGNINGDHMLVGTIGHLIPLVAS